MKKKENSQSQELARLIKEQKCLIKFLSGSGCCVICLNAEPLVLEEHHPGGQKNYPDITITVCANHHSILTRMQGSWPKEWQENNNSIMIREAILFRGLADILRVKSDCLLEAGRDGSA